MSTLDRRNFVKLGVGGLAGLTLGSEAFGDSLRAAETDKKAVILSSAFFMQPGLFAHIDPKTQQLTDYNLGAVNSSAERDLIEGFLSPLKLDLDTLEEWGKTSEGFTRFGSEVPFLATMLRSAAVPNVTELVGQATTALHEKKPLSLSLDFLHPQHSPTFGYEVTSESGFPVIDRVGTPDAKLFQILDLYGWRFIFRGPEYHSLGSCVYTSVWHYNFEIHRALGGGRYQPVSNFHLGKYGNGSAKCFVLWNNLTPRICWKICTPNFDNLKQMLAWSLAASAAAAGVYLAGWIVSAVATAAASVIYVPLLLL